MSLVADVVAALFPLSEVVLALTRRPRGRNTSVQDAGSLRTLWLVIGTCVGASALAARFFPAHVLPASRAEAFATVLLVIGMTVRWWAIVYLGRYFTVQVAVMRNHPLVTTGPYRYIRHPSYTGLLLAFLGLAFQVNHPFALLALTLPVFLAVRHRIVVEEKVLQEHFGPAYEAYAQRTKRLIPLVY